MAVQPGKVFVLSALELSKLLDSAIDKNSTQKVVLSIKEKCVSSSDVVASSALHALTTLVQRGKLSSDDGHSILLSLMVHERRPAGLVAAVCRLLALQPNSEYNISDKPHPFFTMLRHDWGFWDQIFDGYLNGVNLESEKEYLSREPVIIGVLLDPAAPFYAKESLVRLLSGKSSQFYELLSWQKVDFNWCRLLRIFHQTSRDEVPDSVRVAASLRLMASGCDGWKEEMNWDPPSLFLLAAAVPSLPTVYVSQIANVSPVLSDETFANSALATSLLQWALIPNQLALNVSKLASSIIKANDDSPRGRGRQEVHSKELMSLITSHPELCLAHDLADLAADLDKNLPEWLNVVKLRKKLEIYQRYHQLLLGILLQKRDTAVSLTVLQILEDAVKMDNNLAFSTLAVVLHKLSVEKNPELQLAYLKILPQLAANKDNIPLVLATIESLQGGQSDILTPVRLHLLLQLWFIQPRTFPYLHKLLLDTCAKCKKNKEFLLCSSATLLAICRHNDNQGREVINLLSDVLNIPDDTGEAASMAIDAIAVLCKNGVIDFLSTWQVIGPKMRLESRPPVAKAICHLLAQAAGSDEVMGRELVDRLWKFVEQDCAAEEALEALGQFSVDAFPLDSLPAEYRQGLTIPMELLVEGDGDALPENILQYVPGVCWVQLLDKIPSKHQESAKKMVRALLQREVSSFPRGLYHLPLGGTEPRSLDHLPPNSILRALVDCIRRDIKKNSRLVVVVMEILSSDFARPLPPLDWSFLRPWLSGNEERLRRLALQLCAVQGPNSQSARTLLEEFFRLLESDGSLSLFLSENRVTVRENLPGLCQCLTVDTVTQISSQIVQTCLEDDNEFEETIAAIRRTVGLAVVPEKSRIALGKAVKALLADINPDDKPPAFLWSSLSELPDKVIGSVLNPSNWPEITTKRIWVASHVCLAKAYGTKDAQKCPLDNFVDVIDVAYSENIGQSTVLAAITGVLQVTDKKLCRSFVIQLINRLLASIGKENQNQQGCLFLLEIMATTLAILSGYDLMKINYSSLSLLEKLRLFPQSVYSLFIETREPEWTRLVPNVVEGLHRLSKSHLMPPGVSDHLRRGIMVLRSHEYCQDKRWSRLFYENLISTSVS